MIILDNFSSFQHQSYAHTHNVVSLVTASYQENDAKMKSKFKMESNNKKRLDATRNSITNNVVLVHQRCNMHSNLFIKNDGVLPAGEI